MTAEPVDTIRDLATVARHGDGPHPLRCPCGGQVALGGLPAPTYTCGQCGKSRHDLGWLVRRGRVHIPDQETLYRVAMRNSDMAMAGADDPGIAARMREGR
jgi:hypothetical protein